MGLRLLHPPFFNDPGPVRCSLLEIQSLHEGWWIPASLHCIGVDSKGPTFGRDVSRCLSVEDTITFLKRKVIIHVQRIMVENKSQSIPVSHGYKRHRFHRREARNLSTFARESTSHQKVMIHKCQRTLQCSTLQCVCTTCMLDFVLAKFKHQHISKIA